MSRSEVSNEVIKDTDFRDRMLKLGIVPVGFAAANFGDDDGDTLYLDDIAKFAYDIDMRASGTDAAGKSWDAADFTKQNMFTYTVGFTAANAMLSDAATAISASSLRR